MPLTDITHPFLQSCLEIPQGHLVKAPNLHMLDAMNALTILDPRMDTGARVSSKRRRAPVDAEFAVEEVVAVVDRLVQNEMAWHSGWPLVPTVFTSRHLLALDALTNQHTTKQPNNNDPTTTSLLHRILVPYLESYNASLGYTWHELARGAVFEGEDWMGDLAGREEWDVAGGGGGIGRRRGGFAGVRDWTRDERRMRHVASLRRRRIMCIKTPCTFSPMKGVSLRSRVEASATPPPRNQTATTLSGGTPPPDSTTHLISQLTYPPDASALSAPWFDADIPRRFRQSMPVPRVPLPSSSQAYAELGRITDGLHWVCEVRDWTVRPSLDARERQAWVFALGPEGEEAGWNPLVRSCMGWSIVDGFVYPLQQVDLVRHWTMGYAIGGERGFDVDRALYRASGESIERVGEVRRFFDVLCERWQDLSALLPPVFDPEEHAQFIRGIYARRADALLDALLAGFDLGLIEKEEWGSVYWFLWRVAEDRATGDDGRRTWRTSWARAWAFVAKGIHLALSASTTTDTKNPHEQAVFNHRFGPFQPKASSTESALRFPAYSYKEYTDSCSAVSGLSAESRREQVESSLYSAKKALTDVLLQLEAESTGPGEQQRKADETHKAICKYLERRMSAYIDPETDKRTEEWESRCAKWLPPVQDIHGALPSLQ
ncbi:hypothetical protein QFC20_005663 [Naganishia adeliensis]|uniref:Uncharacterized protein n=1 Tax=Naganishia adeliensis TaxID=92952 RepID=A0ACC2VL23_9TREE|nr:hypothetical protein QFC20_005663 [Naganishia adeliensis]